MDKTSVQDPDFILVPGWTAVNGASSNIQSWGMDAPSGFNAPVRLWFCLPTDFDNTKMTTLDLCYFVRSGAGEAMFNIRFSVSFDSITNGININGTVFPQTDNSADNILITEPASGINFYSTIITITDTIMVAGEFVYLSMVRIAPSANTFSGTVYLVSVRFCNQ